MIDHMLLGRRDLDRLNSVEHLADSTGCAARGLAAGFSQSVDSAGCKLSRGNHTHKRGKYKECDDRTNIEKNDHRDDGKQTPANDIERPADGVLRISRIFLHTTQCITRGMSQCGCARLL
jgi:hypothetical protein